MTPVPLRLACLLLLLFNHFLTVVDGTDHTGFVLRAFPVLPNHVARSIQEGLCERVRQIVDPIGRQVLANLVEILLVLKLVPHLGLRCLRHFFCLCIGSVHTLLVISVRHVAKIVAELLQSNGFPIGDPTDVCKDVNRETCTQQIGIEHGHLLVDLPNAIHFKAREIVAKTGDLILRENREVLLVLIQVIRIADRETACNAVQNKRENEGLCCPSRTSEPSSGSLPDRPEALDKKNHPAYTDR